MIRSFTLKPRNKPELEIKMDINPASPQDRFLCDFFDAHRVPYEPDVSCVVAAALRPGDTAVDVGANSGYFTILMSRLVGPSGRVLAFEPDPYAFKRLQRNVELNELTNVEVHDCPLSDREEEVTFWIDQDGGGGSALWDPGLWHANVKSKEKKEPLQLKAKRLFDFVHEARLLKIDTEGAECQVLDGFSRKGGTADFVVAELNPFGLNILNRSVQTLRSHMQVWHGHGIFLIHDSGQLPSLVPSDSIVKTKDGTCVMNVLFSKTRLVAEAWPEVPLW